MPVDSHSQPQTDNQNSVVIEFSRIELIEEYVCKKEMQILEIIFVGPLDVRTAMCITKCRLVI